MNRDSYRINGLYADQGYEVEAGAQGYAPLDPGGESHYQIIFRSISIVNSEPEPYDIQLQPQRILSGRVVDQDDHPHVGQCACQCVEQSVRDGGYLAMV